jgi:hypothetical protein
MCSTESSGVGGRLAAISVAALLAVGFAVSKTPPTLTERIDNANADLMKAQAPIPPEKLHAKGLEILRTRMVAKEDETTSDNDAHAAAEACVVFKKTPLELTTCE